MSIQQLLEIRREIPRRTRVVLAIVSWTLVIAFWYVLTLPALKLLPPFSVPQPIGVVGAFFRLWTEYDLAANVFQSWWRIAQAFVWAAVIAIPLGLLMGGFKWLHDLVNPVAEPMRSMPITAFMPAFIGLLGIDERSKVAFLWFGMFFYLLAVVVEEANRVDNALIETAFTLGANRRQVLWLMFRASFPAIFGSFRILYDLGWTYVILAEIVNARKGVGYMVEAARKVLDFDRVYAGIIAIGLAAFFFRYLLTLLEHWLFPWRRVAPQTNQPAVAHAAAKVQHAK
ncbi:MAG TPA: ABC transporter permease [Bryobacteraceae bacterium]|nr:ABC transporter permease [Bryobacteraceae bacterium]